MTSADADGDAAVAPYAADFQTVSLGTEVYSVVVEEEPNGDGTGFATAAVRGEVERTSTVKGVLKLRG